MTNKKVYNYIMNVNKKDMITKKERESEMISSIVTGAIIVFGIYGIYNFLTKEIEEKDKDRIKVKEVFKEIWEGSNTKRIHLEIREYFIKGLKKTKISGDIS